MTYRPACSKPCGECPFRRKAMPGWLGAAKPESFIIEISMEMPLPCHMSIDYEDEHWQRKWSAQAIGNICAGSLMLSANMAKMPRDPAFPRMPANRVDVFASPQEFIQHHRAASVRSWEFGEDAEREVRPHAQKTETDRQDTGTNRTRSRQPVPPRKNRAKPRARPR